METVALFEEKVPITPRDLSKDTVNISGIILKKMRSKLEGRCSLHGWVRPNSVKILSRSMGYFEKGRFTGDIVYHIQAEGRVVNPPSGIEVVGEVVRKNKMGMFVNYQDAINIILPRDLHIGDEDYDSIEIGERIRVEIKKSRYQVNDEFILSVGIFLGRASGAAEPLPVVKEEEELAEPEPEPEPEVEGAEEEVEEEPVVAAAPVAAPAAPAPVATSAAAAPVDVTGSSMQPVTFQNKSPEFSELNNLHVAPFTVDGKQYASVEHYLQVQKFPSNPDLQEQIRSSKTPSNAKTLAGATDSPVRPDWDAVRDDVVRKALRAKFTQNPKLKDILLSTGDRPLQEISSDSYWGIGRTKKGKNRLGLLLMELRSSLRAEGQ
jgi:hypothetical protein